MMSIRELGIIIAIIGVAVAYIEYHRRKIIAQFSRYTDEKLKEQARKFRGEVSKTMQARAWGDDELDALMDMMGEFFKISPFDSSRHQPIAAHSNKELNIYEIIKTRTPNNQP